MSDERAFRDAVVRPLVSAVLHTHSLGYVHRDIKAENVMLSDVDGGVKLGDFGFAAEVKDENPLVSRVGTLEYMAPEVLKCDKNSF